MSELNDNWPEPGDLVMATINTVMDYGAYANLDEYNRRGFLHISEISSARIRNIRDFVRSNQKLVLKVLRVDIEKGHIDLSLRRVNRRERIEKIKSWKEDRKADALLHAVADKAGLTFEEVNQQVGLILREKFGLYAGFEKASKEGASVLSSLGIPENLANIVALVAAERIKVKMVTLRGIVEVRCMQPNGIKCIKESFSKAKKAHKYKDAKIEFSVIAAPKYRVEVSAENWKRAQDVIERVGESIVANVTSAGGSGNFKLDK